MFAAVNLFERLGVVFAIGSPQIFAVGREVSRQRVMWSALAQNMPHRIFGVRGTAHHLAFPAVEQT